ncbi:MAG: ribonuclease Z, partial [Flavobacteriales bacterium]|nr:ribonuclease Z [Flavobacteriales bacterium]
LFREQAHAPKINKNAVIDNDLTISEINQIKKGASHIRTGEATLPATALCLPPSPLRSYAYVTDTKPSPAYKMMISEVDLLYHESTFADDQAARADETFHSTARQAGVIARECAVKKLIIGHFSTRYHILDTLLKEAREEFPNTHLALEGETFPI